MDTRKIMTKTKLEKEQFEAIEHGDGPLLIIAGAGTGKTTVITERIKYLILKKKIPPSEILALTFTEKAALEMEERVDLAMPYGYTQMWISTFHSFCDRILRSEAIHIGISSSYKVLTEAESVLFIRKNIQKFNLNYFRPFGNPNKFLEAMVSHFSRLKDEDVDPLQYMQFVKKMAKDKSIDKEEKERYEELANAYKVYEDLKIKEGYFDFSDLIANTLKLFRSRKNILKTYQDQFKYVLVDEFQDTNYAQNELSELLAGERKNITVVGDDDQSIYRFRGSSVSNIIQFKKKFPKTKVVTLIKNFRSTKEILDTSYRVIQNNNPDRLEVKENINKKLISAREIEGEKVEFIYTKRVEDEGDEIAKGIKEQLGKYKYQDIAILVRANDHSEPIMRALERYKIPYQFLGPGRLFNQEEIKNLIAYLKVLYNFEDSTSLYRVLTMPIFKFQPIEVAILLNLAKKRNYTLFEAMDKLDETGLSEITKEKMQYIQKMIKRHLGLVRKDTAGQILYYFLQDSGILKEVANAKSEIEEKEAKNIARFFDKLKTYEVEHISSSVFDIVEWIDLSMQMGESPLAATLDWTENNAVNILSVHSSKGLEFPVVFLVNLVMGRFPTRERKEVIPIPQQLIKEILPTGDYHLEEERRLFYVGMTRAKDKLFLSASSFYGEGKQKRKISPFVYEALGEKTISDMIQKQEKGEGQLSLLDLYTTETEEKSPVAKRQPITYLSYSQIQTFEICPLHYKLRYILKIPTPQTSAQSFGTSIHSTLRDFYMEHLKGQKLKPQDALAMLERNWINEGYDNKHDETKSYERGKKLISSYIERNFDEKKLPLALEFPFQFMLDDLKIGGRIDRIDALDNGKIEVIDYKTGRNMPDEKKLAIDQQLNVYALAATMVADKVLNKKAEDVILSLYYLELDKKISTTRTVEQLENAKKSILEKRELISQSSFLCSGNNLCIACEYKMLCSTK
ncbi:MAG TPA: ATP-dependent DNA helicase [Patescibacteria group bacterium]|nr:ATP-dependent DNA helicase [Patescibacteria group bacterium]